MFRGLLVAVLGEGTLGEFRATMSLGVVLLELSPLPPLIRYCRKLFWPEQNCGLVSDLHSIYNVNNIYFLRK